MTNEQKAAWIEKLDAAFKNLNAVIEASMDAEFLIEVAALYKRHRTGAILYQFDYRPYDPKRNEGQPCDCPACRMRRILQAAGFAEPDEAQGSIH